MWVTFIIPVCKMEKQIGEKTFTFFYGYTGPYGYLSNFFIAPLTMDGKQFNCGEQAYQYLKAEFFGDTTTMEKIQKERLPFYQKGLGQHVSGFNAKKWENVRVEAMLKVLRCKFRTFNRDDYYLKNRLLKTKGTTLVEASPKDSFWGIKMGINNPYICNTSSWGENQLGKCLEVIRDELMIHFDDDMC